MKKDKLEILFDKIYKKLNLKFDKKTKKLFLQMFKFLFVGGLAFLIDYVTLIICKEVFNIPLLLSAAIAFTVSVVVNYKLSVMWVFDIDKGKNKHQTFIIFIIFSIIGLILTELIMWIGSVLLEYNYLFVKIVATAIVMVFNFVTRKIFLEENSKEKLKNTKNFFIKAKNKLTIIDAISCIILGFICSFLPTYLTKGTFTVNGTLIGKVIVYSIIFIIVTITLHFVHDLLIKRKEKRDKK